MPVWVIAAERTFLLAQALPNRSTEEIENMTSDELDAILGVASVYRNVFGQDPYRHTH